MGTPAFAVASLDALVQAGCNIVAVITAPDKPAGRGMKLNESEVKKYAMEKGLNLLQPVKLKDPEFINMLRNLKADLQIVVAFRMLPEIVWNMPPMGTINLHGSLLPQYRGAAPINWALINGDKFTGVTTFKLKHEIDTGDILLRKEIPLGENDTAGELHDRMKEIGADLLVETVKGLEAGTLNEVPQEYTPGEDIRHAPKIFTDTCKIDWIKTSTEVHNLIRGLSPFPGAFTTIQNKTLKIYRSVNKPEISGGEPGQISTDHKNWLRFSCGQGTVEVLELQMEGKKRMGVQDFLKGFRF